MTELHFQRLACGLENMAHSEASQGVSALVKEEKSLASQRDSSVDEPILDEPGSLWPQGANAFFASFTKHTHLNWAFKVKIAGTQFQNLLDSAARVVEQGKQDVVAQTALCCPVRLLHERIHFLQVQVLHGKGPACLKGIPSTWWQWWKCSGSSVERWWNKLRSAANR